MGCFAVDEVRWYWGLVGWEGEAAGGCGGELGRGLREGFEIGARGEAEEVPGGVEAGVVVALGGVDAECHGVGGLEWGI